MYVAPGRQAPFRSMFQFPQHFSDHFWTSVCAFAAVELHILFQSIAIRHVSPVVHVCTSVASILCVFVTWVGGGGRVQWLGSAPDGVV